MPLMHSSWRSAKTLHLVSGVLVLAAAAEAQDSAEDGLFHVRVGPMIGLNIRADFHNTGPFNLAAAQAPGSYDDGYVRPDQTGNAGGLTSDWGYQNASQLDAASQSLRMHQATTFSAPSSSGTDDAPYFGGEIAGGGEVWRSGSWRLGWEVGCGVLPISINNQQGQPVNVNQNVYSFSTGAIVVPTAPYNGGSSGLGPLISATGTQVSSETVPGSYAGTETLQATLVAFKLGPTLFWDLNRHLGLQAGVGPAVGVLPGSLKFDDTVRLPDGTSPHTDGRLSSTPVTFGGYVNAIATVHMAKNLDFYFGAQYLPLDSVNFGGNGHHAELKLSGQVNFMAGINWPF